MAKLTKLTAGILLFMLLNVLIYSFDFSPVDLQPNNATTENNLLCTWTPGGGNVNVTWYNNSVQYGSPIVNASNPQSISSGIAKKGQVWNCTIVEWNDSSNRLSDSLTIQNAYPTPPDIENTTLYEDQLYSFTLVSTDADGDTVRFPLYESDTVDLDSFNTVTGDLSWTPSLSDVGLHNITFYSKDNVPVLIGKEVVFNVSSINDRPNSSTLLPDISILEGTRLQYNVTMIDEENNSGPFTFYVNSTFTPIEQIDYNTTNYKTFVIQFLGNRTAAYSDVNNYTINIRACDPANSSLCFNDSFNLEVVTVNHAPNITAIESKDRNYSEGENFTLYINATDIDIGDALNFTLTPTCSQTNPWIINLINSSSNATAAINATPLNDTHIACRNVTVQVFDTRNGQYSVNLRLNVTNINDVPSIMDLSYSIQNSQSNVNLTNLTAYQDVLFTYMINATDEDILFMSDALDTLTYRSNSSLCSGNCPTLSLGSSTGLLSFMPNQSFIGNYSYNINVTDSYGANSSKTITIRVLPNLAPFFNQTPPNITAYEEVQLNMTLNATDPEGSFGTFSDNSSLFAINSTGFFSFTPSCSNTGNYSVLIKINDTLGRENQSSFWLEVRNVPDAPVLPSISNVTILEEFPYYLDVNSSTSDGDIACSQEDSLTFTSSFISGSTVFNISSGGIISFTPNDTSAGSYLINITAVDSFNLSGSTLWNLTIINRSSPPAINNVSPYGYPYFAGWSTLAGIGSNLTTINISENSTIIYDHNSTDADGNPLIFNWTVDGIVSGSAKNLSKSWNFTDSGIHNVTLAVSDMVNGTAAHHVRFTWNTSVNNLNRPPVLNNSLSNVSVNGTVIIGNYLVCGNYISGNCNEIRFNDPDSDSLTYTHSTTTKATITISGDTVTFTGVEIGNETVQFNASDGSSKTSSNTVTLFINELPDEESSSSSSSTSSSSRSSSSYVPYSVIQEVEKDKEIYFDIIVPEPITIYKNDTIREVISFVNNGNKTLRGINLYAVSNASGANISFSNNYFSELKPGETKKTDLIVSAYKLLNNYELILFANITDPKYSDKAVIYINAIEKSRGNQSVTATKITFAKDLLNSNPECLELNEFLKRAQNEIENERYDEASKILDSVVQGCKYLVSQSKVKNEKPGTIILGFDLDSIPFIKPILAALAVIMAAGIIVTAKLRKENEKED